jgi:predicted transcriptional regulator
MVVVDILPIVRKELALELIKAHKMRKAAVARLFNVSGTAISQYVHGSRGNRAILEGSPLFGDFMAEIKSSAKRLASEKTGILEELCSLCGFVKRMGLMEVVYEEYGEIPAIAKCPECPKNNINCAPPECTGPE